MALLLLLLELYPPTHRQSWKLKHNIAPSMYFHRHWTHHCLGKMWHDSGNRHNTRKKKGEQLTLEWNHVLVFDIVSIVALRPWAITFIHYQQWSSFLWIGLSFISILVAPPPTISSRLFIETSGTGRCQYSSCVQSSFDKEPPLLTMTISSSIEIEQDVSSWHWLWCLLVEIDANDVTVSCTGKFQYLNVGAFESQD